jgi:hypothetical protein
MISTQLAKLAEQNHWQTDPQEDTVYGNYNGYRFSLMDGIGFKAIFTPVAGIKPAGLQALEQWLTENTKALKLRNFELAENFLCVRLKESWTPRTAEQLEWILAQLSGMLDQFETPHEACAICGLDSDRQGLLHGLFCALHPECLDRGTVDFIKPSAESPDEVPAEMDPETVELPSEPDAVTEAAEPEATESEEVGEAVDHG